MRIAGEGCPISPLPEVGEGRVRGAEAVHRRDAEGAEKTHKICHKGHQVHEGELRASVLEWKNPGSIFVTFVLSLVLLAAPGVRGFLCALGALGGEIAFP